MKIKELKDKILIAELDPNKDYIILFNPSLVQVESIAYARSRFKRTRKMPLVAVYDIDKAVKFIEVPTKK